MSKLKFCKICGKRFEAEIESEICAHCFEQDEKVFSRIRDYVREHPGAKIFEVSTVLNVSIQRIKRYLREDRLEILEKSSTFLSCATCGKPIRSGWYCDDCYKESRNNNLKVAYNGSTFSKRIYSHNYTK